MLKKGIVISLALATAAAFSAPGWAKGAAVESQWPTVPVRIDGADQDWQDARLFTDEGSRAQYAIQNDGRDLYILLVFPGPESSTTIAYTGLKAYFNVDGKKNKDSGILFTKKALDARTVIAEMEKRGQALTEEQKAELLKQKTQMVLVEEPVNPKKMTAISDPTAKTEPPIYRAVGKGRGGMIYEIRIPLSRANEARGIGAQPGQSILLGFEWGGMTTQIWRQMMGGEPGGGTQASERGMRSDAGFSDESRDGGMGDSRGLPQSSVRNDPRYKKHSFWIDVKLASKTS
jgi:hypothetical protein